MKHIITNIVFYGSFMSIFAAFGIFGFLIYDIREYNMQKTSITMPEALTAMQIHMKNNFDLAWGWHCNIACMAMDEGLKHEAANKAAARFMQLTFYIDTSDKAYLKWLSSSKDSKLEDGE